DLVEAVQEALALLRGTYGLAVLSRRCPDVLVGACLGSPLVVGIGEGEHFLASDPAALAGMADKVVYLEDHQVCELTPNDWRIRDRARTAVRVNIQHLDRAANERNKGHFRHYMLNEICEQPESR